MMIKVGITGQNGFVGSHLFNEISLLREEFSLVPFDRTIFDSDLELQNWVKQCDVIVHFAALNRHESPEVIYNTNIDLVKLLIVALEKTGHTPHVIFSSSTQEANDNLYGESKRTGRQLLEQWSKQFNACFTGMIIPNVFGPFGRPYYNSVVATFCHQMCNGKIPIIDKDSQVKLIFVNELTQEILDAIRNRVCNQKMLIRHTSEVYVSELLSKLENYKSVYLEKGNIPILPDNFSLNLFNTFRSFINHSSYFPFKLTPHTDNRGSFFEIIRLEQGGQVSFSTTRPRITRGNHFHTRKIERFTVIKGEALIQLRKFNTKEVLEFELNGQNASYVDMPIWYTHNIKNIGDEDLYTVFWINECFDAADPDTYFEVV